jgi:hypothetical protein
MAKIINERFDIELKPLHARIAQLEAQIKERGAVEYVGVWRTDGEYQRGNLATTNGSLFHCEMSGTKSRPGTDATWKLCVKQGTFSWWQKTGLILIGPHLRTTW